jgi:tetratricopeptide (TPR) repeat protein
MRLRSPARLASAARVRIFAAVPVRPSILFLVLLAASLLSAWGHGDVHQRIDALTLELAASPTNASLYFQRAELHRIDQNWTNALSDLEMASKHDGGLPRLDFCRGRVHLEAGHPRLALAPLDRYLASNPPDPDGYATRGRAHVKLEQFALAAADFTHAIALSSSSPELYIERAEALRRIGRLEESLRGLDEGIAKLGPLVTLQLPAIDLEVALQRPDAALARIDAVSARMARKETWLFRRAEVLRQAGRVDEAQKNYRDALAAIDRLPPTHRGTRAMAELKDRIQSALATK